MKKQFFFIINFCLILLASSCQKKHTCPDHLNGLRDYFPYETGDIVRFVGEDGDTIIMDAKKGGSYFEEDNSGGPFCGYYTVRSALNLRGEHSNTNDLIIYVFVVCPYDGTAEMCFYVEGMTGDSESRNLYASIDESGIVNPINYSDTIYLYKYNTDDTLAILVKDVGLVMFVQKMRYEGDGHWWHGRKTYTLVQ